MGDGQQLRGSTKKSREYIDGIKHPAEQPRKPTEQPQQRVAALKHQGESGGENPNAAERQFRQQENQQHGRKIDPVQWQAEQYAAHEVKRRIKRRPRKWIYRGEQNKRERRCRCRQNHLQRTQWLVPPNSVGVAGERRGHVSIYGHAHEYKSKGLVSV